MIEANAFHCLSYGLYIVSSEANGKAAGCVANTFAQVTSTPLQVSVTLNKDNATTSVVREAGRYTASCLSEEATMELIGTFGFHSSSEIDKFAEVEEGVDEAGVPYVAAQACAWFSVRIVQEIDLGTHIMFIGEVEQAERIGADAPMTYAFYHQVKGGKTPPKASSYLPEELGGDQPVASGVPSGKTRVAWRCTVCGHIEYVDELPDDFMCPICGVGKDMFERIEVEA